MLVYNARKKVEIAERAAAARQRVQRLRERVEDLRRDINDQRARHQRTDGAPLTDDDRARLDERLDPMRTELEAYEEALERAEADLDAVNDLADAVGQYVAENAAQADPEPAAPKPADTQSAPEKLATTRKELGEARTERDRLAEAQLPAAEAKRRIDAYVDAAADPDRAQRLAHLALTPEAKLGEDHLNPRMSLGPNRVPLEPLLCWLFGDQVKAALHVAVDAQADAKAAVSEKKRERSLADLDGKIDQLARTEEELITGLEAAGHPVERRADADPAIVLEVRQIGADAPVEVEGADDEEDADEEHTDDA